MINVKIDKGVGSMTFAGNGSDVTAELMVIVHSLYTQLYMRAGALIANGCKRVIIDMLAREGSPVWDVELGRDSTSAFYLEGDAAEAMLARLRNAEGGRQHDDS
nr:MAG TPA: hypothetical protein [Caudoviricetes sp.]